ncbi:MAG TPA: glycosyltransferase [Gemmataceae bacterium]|nr:glycosyltransferase [Gemmataceae bacterium]
MRLTALVEGQGHVCCRYRLAAFRPFLEAAGHSLNLRPWPRRAWHWPALLRELRQADVTIIQRRLLPGWLLALVRRSSRFLVFDLDDAVFLRDSYSPRGLHCPRRLRRFAAVCRAADAVAAGNHFLADAADRHAGPGRGHVIPTCVDPLRYPVARHERAGEGVELVWVGSSSTLQGLMAVRPLLENLGVRHPGLRLKLVCDRFFHLDHLPVVPCPWSEASEPAAIAAADVGISWVPDDLWSRGKCGLKVLQYMAAGLPVVANPVGVQAEMVRHGETGFLAGTPEEWAEAVGRLARDPELRRRMGRAGRRRVEEAFAVSVGAGRWLALLGGLGRGRQAA